MSGAYYVHGPERSERVRALFGRIASRYDLINDVQSLGLHRLWKRKLVRAARAGPIRFVLDVCCGTGDLAVRLAPHVEQVIGCDFTPEMLERAGERGARNISWVQANALELPFPKDSFDIVTIGYGLRNLADFNRGIGELVRVLRPGGRVLILDFGKPKSKLLRWAYFTYLRVIVPLFGVVFCGDSAAYIYILDSLKHYPAQEGVTRLLNEAGCESVRVVNYVGGAMSLHIATKSPLFGQRDDVSLKTSDLVR